MAPSPSPFVADALLDVAWTSIHGGLLGRGPFVPDLRDAPDDLRALGAAFVTVTVDGQLNGCIGTTEPVEPLGGAVGRLAWSAAFADPRLPPLTRVDLPATSVMISVLGPLEPIVIASSDELCRALRPGIDGLVLEADGRRATFLPAVWASLPDPADFVRHLHAKAGLRPDRWTPDTRCFRYEVTEIG